MGEVDIEENKVNQEMTDVKHCTIVNSDVRFDIANYSFRRDVFEKIPLHISLKCHFERIFAEKFSWKIGHVKIFLNEILDLWKNDLVNLI